MDIRSIIPKKNFFFLNRRIILNKKHLPGALCDVFAFKIFYKNMSFLTKLITKTRHKLCGFLAFFRLVGEIKFLQYNLFFFLFLPFVDSMVIIEL